MSTKPPVPTINLDPKSLRTDGRNNVTGILFFSTKDGEFPDASWNDRVTVVLSWWCETLLAFESTSIANKALLRFMDGPFSIEVESFNTSDHLQLTFLRQRTPVYSATMSRSELRRQVVGASKQTIDFCISVGATGDDIMRLSVALNACCES